MRKHFRKPVKKTVPAPIETVLEYILQQRDALGPMRQLRLVRACRERIGEEFGRHLQPDKVMNGTLYCTVDSPSWQQQYQFFSADILKRLNNPPLEVPITGLRFTVGSFRESEYISDEKMREKARRAELRKQLPVITPDEIKHLRDTVGSIHPDLRQDAGALIDEWVAFLDPGFEEEK